MKQIQDRIHRRGMQIFNDFEFPDLDGNFSFSSKQDQQ